MTRHLLGLRAGLPGGRRFRRALSELADGQAGLAELREIAAGFADEPASEAPFGGALYAFS